MLDIKQSTWAYWEKLSITGCTFRITSFTWKCSKMRFAWRNIQQFYIIWYEQSMWKHCVKLDEALGLQTSLDEANHFLPMLILKKFNRFVSAWNMNWWMWGLSGKKLTPKLLEHYLHLDQNMPQLLLGFVCLFTYLQILQSPPTFN